MLSQLRQHTACSAQSWTPSSRRRLYNDREDESDSDNDEEESDTDYDEDDDTHNGSSKGSKAAGANTGRLQAFLSRREGASSQSSTAASSSDKESGKYTSAEVAAFKSILYPEAPEISPLVRAAHGKLATPASQLLLPA